MVAWKGLDHSCSWALFAELWRAEEWDMEVPRGYKQTLAGSLQPLTGAQQNASGVPPIPTNCPSAAITDVTENMRAKVYTLCLKMGMQKLIIVVSGVPALLCSLCLQPCRVPVPC